jgi:hypothetical protein
MSSHHSTAARCKQPLQAQDDAAVRLHKLFGGDRANGYDPASAKKDEQDKVRVTAHKWTRKPTAALWNEHLHGEIGLGILAADAGGRCQFGCLDIDDYQLDVLATVKIIERHKLPLIPCQSKSDGLHLYLFVSESVPVDLMERTLKNLAARLGLKIKAKEVDGKTELLYSTTVWAPYLGGGACPMIKPTGCNATVGEFLNAAEAARQTPAQIAALAQARPPAKTNGAAAPSGADNEAYAAKRLKRYVDELAATPKGERNTALTKRSFHLGCMTASGWIDRVEIERVILPVIEQWDNREKTLSTFSRALDDGAKEPHRDRGDGAPVIVAWRKVNSDDPVWYVMVEGSTVEMEIRRIDDITNYRRFADQCAKQLNRFFPPVKAAEWARILSAAASSLVTEQAPADVTRVEIFRESIEEFLTNRARGERREDLLSGRPWENVDKARHEFRMRDLHDHLAKNGLRDVDRHDLQKWIKQLGGGRVSTTPTTLAGKGVRLWHVPTSVVQATPPLDTPPLPGDEI